VRAFIQSSPEKQHPSWSWCSGLIGDYSNFAPASGASRSITLSASSPDIDWGPIVIDSWVGPANAALFAAAAFRKQSVIADPNQLEMHLSPSGVPQ
jgi:hypothetical protein